MKYLLRCILFTALTGLLTPGVGKALDEYLNEAEHAMETGAMNKAVGLLNEATQEYPDSARAHVMLGTYLAELVQQMNDFGAMMPVIARVFMAWDRALELEPDNFEVRFQRGTWAVSVPKSVGQLQKGIKDMELIATNLGQSPDPALQELAAKALYYQGIGIQRTGEYTKAKQVFNKVIAQVPDTELAAKARTAVDDITTVELWMQAQARTERPDDRLVQTLKTQLANDPDNYAILVSLGKAYLDAKKYERAAAVLKQALALKETDVELYELLITALQQVTAQGYDPRIMLDTDLRTDLAFEISHLLDKAITLAPDDIELRLMRCVTGVQMPFFVGRLDQSLFDLNIIAQSDVPEEIKAQAKYWLGVGYQKKAMSKWLEIISIHPESAAVRSVFNQLYPSIDRLPVADHKPPYVSIDFLLGFKDELAPQTAIWVEDLQGNYIATVYVSGFSGNAKSKQINLPAWSRTSEFTAVDAVTGASIDLGHHIYVWNTRDHHGRLVPVGDYQIHLEVAFWPSMQYQHVQVPVRISKKNDHALVEEGNLIPYLEVNYMPKK